MLRDPRAGAHPSRIASAPAASPRLASSSMPGPIAHFGTFDVANYGDLLFPLILERRLGDLAPILHVSPVGGPPPLPGARPSIAPDALPDRLRGVVVGGGHLIHASPSSLPAYRARPELALRAYPSLWLGAAERALVTGAPLVWNGPGVPAAFGPRAGAVVAWATGFVDRLGVRDERSRDLLIRAGCEAPCEVVPDTALEVASLFDRPSLDRAYHEAHARHGRSCARPTLAIHPKARYLRDDVPLVAARIERMAEQIGALPILLALGPCHGDDALVRAIARAMRGPVLAIDAPRSLVELAACIAHSVAYVGSSLHGAITACAFGVPAALVAREPGDGGKFSEFCRANGLETWLWRDWEEAERRLIDLTRADPTGWARVSATARPALDAHWSRVRSALSSPPARSQARADAPARRAALLRADLDAFGVHALLLAHQAELSVDQLDRLEREREQRTALKASYREAARALRERIRSLEPSTIDPGTDGSS